MAHTFALLFNDNHFWSQVPTCTSTFTGTSDQFLSKWRSEPYSTPRIQIGLLLQRKGPSRGTVALQAPDHKPSLFSTFVLALSTFSCLVSICCTAIISETLKRLMRTSLPRDSQHVGFRAEASVAGASKHSPVGQTVRPQSTSNDFWSLVLLPKGMVQNTNLSAELRFESGCLQNRRQEPRTRCLGLIQIYQRNFVVGFYSLYDLAHQVHVILDRSFLHNIVLLNCDQITGNWPFYKS